MSFSFFLQTGKEIRVNLLSRGQTTLEGVESLLFGGQTTLERSNYSRGVQFTLDPNYSKGGQIILERSNYSGGGCPCPIRLIKSVSLHYNMVSGNWLVIIWEKMFS